MRRDPEDSLTVKERKNRLKIVTSELNNEGYRDSFRNILTYYEFLLLQIVISAEISQRGVLISNFYNVKRILYFPSPSNRIKLKRVNTKEYSDSYFESEPTKTSFFNKYNFYAISGDVINKFSDLQEILDDVADEPRSILEKDRFQQRLTEASLGSYQITSLNTFRHNKTNNYYCFGEVIVYNIYLKDKANSSYISTSLF
ncbi:MAG: hypothetical protein ACRD6U_05230 [Nitrososphaeraceae archaeon]